MGPKYRFNDNNLVGEKVLCFHGPLLYEAKCIKAQTKDKVVKYYVHYQGWNKSWDEWVPESRVLKFNEENVRRQKELKEAHDATKARSRSGKKRSLPGSMEKEKDADSPGVPDKPVPKQKGGSTPGPSAPAEAKETPREDPKKKKTRIEPQVETEHEFAVKMEVKIKIPDELKVWLVDDWDYVTKQKKLVELPAKVTVDHILEEYMKHKKAAKGMTPARESALHEVSQGIKEYFNTMLGCQLLYKFERPQYQKLMKEHEDRSMTTVYGAIHLLRLFVKLGQMLVYTALDDKSVQLLLTHLHDFLKFLVRNPSYFNSNNYSVAPPEYHRKTV
jgi:mortality factor 4-like protein 1